MADTKFREWLNNLAALGATASGDLVSVVRGATTRKLDIHNRLLPTGGANGKLAGYSGGNPTWVDPPAAAPLDQRKYKQYSHEFGYNPSSPITANVVFNGCYFQLNGDGAAVYFNEAPYTYAHLFTGTLASGYSGFQDFNAFIPDNLVDVSSWVWKAAPLNLSTSGERFRLFLGLSDTATIHQFGSGTRAAPFGVGFIYSDNEASGNWQAFANQGGGSYYSVNTGVAAVNGGAIANLRDFEIRWDATNGWRFYIEGSLVATFSPNLNGDVTTTRGTSLKQGVVIAKRVGTTGRVVLVDHMSATVRVRA